MAMGTLARLSLAAVLLASLQLEASGHGATSFPPPRNAIDGDLPPWSGAVPVTRVGGAPFTGWCPTPSNHSPDPRNLTGANGQACFWFSNGCTIGCAKCDGVTRGPIPDLTGARCVDQGNSGPGAAAVKPGTPCAKQPALDPATGRPGCAKAFKATNCDPLTRTINRGAACGAADDYYYYSPWRAPGDAPVFDACGLAGGFTEANPTCGYDKSAHAKLGDKGSALRPTAPGAVWRAGGPAEVGWSLQANHGGGYIYRLCRTDDPLGLTEACFQKTPLAFTGRSSFRWNGEGGARHFFDGTYVKDSRNATWAMNPVPRNDTYQTGASFAPRCDEVPGCNAHQFTNETQTKQDATCKCSGIWGPYNMEIVDTVLIPAGLAPGDYVLGWRYDCEESSQVWASCSDVRIA